jgi:hypothetical protein
MCQRGVPNKGVGCVGVVGGRGGRRNETLEGGAALLVLYPLWNPTCEKRTNRNGYVVTWCAAQVSGKRRTSDF